MSHDTRRFLNALYTDVPSEHWFYLWTLPPGGKGTSHWYRSDQLDQAVTDVEHWQDVNVYAGVGLSETNRGPRSRVKLESTSGIVGAWADIDVAHPEAHPKPGLPPTERDARKLLAAIGAPPSALVRSGFGFQAWWLFHEPWIFDDDDERAEAAGFMLRWQHTVAARADELGWTVDSVGDLARIMRVPGTTNHKIEGDPRPTSLTLSRPRYNADDLESVMIEVDLAPVVRLHPRVGTLTLRADVDLPATRFNALADNHRWFKRTYKRTRKNLADRSASGYDLALANMASKAGWNDQEIADLLIASRREHGDELKLDRPDYYAMTIAKARGDVAPETGPLLDVIEGARVADDPDAAAVARKELRAWLSDKLRVSVARVVRYTSESPGYFLLTDDEHRIALGEFLQQTVRVRVFKASKQLPPKFSTREWDEIQQAIGTLSEDEDVGVEATDAGQAFIWLSEYLADRPAHSDLDQAAQGQVPYQLEEGGWFIFGPAFRDWLQRTRNERLTPSRMGEILRAYGCEHSVVNVEVNQKRTTRSVWSVPDYASNGHGVLRGIAPGRGATTPPGAPGSGRGSPEETPG